MNLPITLPAAKSFARIYAYLLAGLCFVFTAASPVRAAPPLWNLAVVVESSAEMEKNWLGASKRKAAIKAVEQEIRSLPLRIRTGLWLADGQGAKELIPPGEAVRLKGLELSWPGPGKGAVNWSQSLAAPLAWLKQEGRGSLLIITSGEGAGPQEAHIAGAVSKDGPFVHLLALGHGGRDSGLGQVALAGGGAFFVADKPVELARVIHRAARNAISPARLLIHAANRENQPVRAVYSLKRSGQEALEHRGLTNRQVQLLPGHYRLVWPKASGLGPPPLPAKASVPSRLVELWAGGSARLMVKPVGMSQEQKPWRIKITRLWDGKVVKPLARAPYELTLPAGRYIASCPNMGIAWRLRLKAGAEIKLLVGPEAELVVGLLGPGGEIRVPVEVFTDLDDRRLTRGNSNAVMKLPPGGYRLLVGTIPPMERKVRLEPLQKKRLELPPTGGLLVEEVKAGRPLRYRVLDLKGRELAGGISGRLLPLMPGSYQLGAQGSAKLVKVEILPTETATVAGRKIMR